MELIRFYFMTFAFSVVRELLAQEVPCVYQACTCAYGKVSCENLNSIPPLVPGSDSPDITMAYFSAGNIANVDDNSLPPHLTTIHFVNNPISKISSNAFLSSATTLDSLVIRKAALTSLPDAIGKLQNLTHLAIMDTNIQEWNQSVLQNISKTLKSLNLQNVGLKAWPSWISLFSLLETVIIFHSPLAPIPDGALDHVTTTLKTLDFIDTNLSTIPPAISKLNLTTLSLSNNNLSNVTGIPKCEYVELGSNQISDAVSLSTALNPSAPYLHTLYLDNNNLTVIPNLSHLTKMDLLVLSNNQISDSNSGSLPQSLATFAISGNRLQSVPTIAGILSNLVTLVLSSNQITSFSSSAFPQQLEELHLDDNKITQLVASSFPVVSNLTYLYLQSNPIISIHRSAFLPLKHLKVLNLGDTKLVQVPVALISLINLDDLSIENTRTLNCSCPMDTSLVQWFNSTKLFSVSGSCSSGVEIKDFYSATECGLATSPPGLAPALLSSILCMCTCLSLLLVVCEFPF